MECSKNDPALPANLTEVTAAVVLPEVPLELPAKRVVPAAVALFSTAPSMLKDFTPVAE